LDGSQVSVVQEFVSAHLGGVPALQTPARQVSAPLHAFPSLHDAPSAAGRLRQPVAGSQLSRVQRFVSAQLGGVPALQTPA
jgi:hypothetical protein